MAFGILKCEPCNRDGCKGVIEEHSKGDCSCHINPPCSSCTTPREYCPECDWDAEEEQRAEYFNGFRGKPIPNSSYMDWKPRPLDPSKIDYHSNCHTHFSMIKEGVFPEGTSRQEVEEKVRGTFGGRFEYFGNGKFKYVAYTD